MKKTAEKGGEIDLLKTAIVLPGVNLTRTGLEFVGKPTEETVALVGHTLQVVQGSSLWWWGDYLAKMTEMQRGRKAARQKRGDDKAKKDEQFEMQCITEFAELSGCALPGQLHERAKVARFFPAAMRLPELTFEHHVEAWLAADNDQAKAMEWLHEAVKKTWRVPQLRAHIRTSLAAGAEGSRREPVEQRPDDVDVTFTNMEQLAARRLPRVRGYDKAHATKELALARNVVAYVDELRTRATD